MKWFWRILIFIGVVITLIFAAGAVFIFILGQRALKVARQGPAVLAAEQRILHRDGAPTTPAELQPPLPPISLNAAPDYEKLTALLKKKPVSPEDDAAISDLGQNGRSTPAEDSVVSQILKRRSDIMDLVDRAARKPKCVFVRDWAKGVDLMLPEYAPMREAVRFLRARSYLMAKEGHYRAAIAIDELGFRVADHAGQDPILIGYLVDIACDAITLSGMEQILQMSGPNPAIADEVQTAIANHRPTINLRRALGGEVVLDTGTAHLTHHQGPTVMATQSGEAPDPALLSRLGSATGYELIDAMLAKTLHYQRLLIETTSLPESQQRAAYERVIAKATHSSDGNAYLFNPENLFAAIMIPALGQAADKEYYAHARERVIMAGAAVLAYRARHGSYPNRLDQAAPNLPLDPFTQKPLLYRREPHGFVVYSAGPAGHFNGGEPGMKRSAKEAYFRYPAP
ncbi:MAG TPA: hypothetical protein VFJ58_24880 [Armatimonadota bacterium]|nr:hypothetical protein [Armatimonadota bacterium]